jgi:hypothetical protein
MTTHTLGLDQDPVTAPPPAVLLQSPNTKVERKQPKLLFVFFAAVLNSRTGLICVETNRFTVACGTVSAGIRGR